MAGVPSWDQALLLQGPKLGWCTGPRRDHFVEAELQSCGVVVWALMLWWKGGSLNQLAPQAQVNCKPISATVSGLEEGVPQCWTAPCFAIKDGHQALKWWPRWEHISENRWVALTGFLSIFTESFPCVCSLFWKQTLGGCVNAPRSPSANHCSRAVGVTVCLHWAPPATRVCSRAYWWACRKALLAILSGETP